MKEIELLERANSFLRNDSLRHNYSQRLTQHEIEKIQNELINKESKEIIQEVEEAGKRYIIVKK